MFKFRALKIILTDEPRSGFFEVALTQFRVGAFSHLFLAFTFPLTVNNYFDDVEEDFLRCLVMFRSLFVISAAVSVASKISQKQLLRKIKISTRFQVLQ